MEIYGTRCEIIHFVGLLVIMGYMFDLSKNLGTLVNGRKWIEQINKLHWFVWDYIFELKQQRELQ